MSEKVEPSSSKMPEPSFSDATSLNRDLGKRTVLVVDDAPDVALCHSEMLTIAGYRALIQTDPREVCKTLELHDEIELILLDLRMPHISGLDLVLQIKAQRPDVGVIIATVINDIESAVSAMRAGGYNYILKPVSLARLTEVCASFFSNRPVRRINDPRFSRFITTSPLFEGVFKKVAAFAEIDTPVLVCGETGTGKELVAMQLHALSKRWNKKFTPINIAAISPGLFESSLFGHKRGSFTGAHRDHKGYLEQAADGSIFLDEIGELGLDEQKKLLRVFQSNVFSAVGSTVEIPLTAKVILATNRNLRNDAENNRFRHDLFYRLAGHVIELPALRERACDIPALADYFLHKYSTQYGRRIKQVSVEALAALVRYRFPGNVRELEGMISAAVLLETTDQIALSSLPRHVYKSPPPEDLEGANMDSVKLKAIYQAIQECGGNKTLAAKKLGISRSTICRLTKSDDDNSVENL